MITAVLVTFVVMIMAGTAVSLSLHSSQQSANDRRRVDAIQAAEAGLDYYFSYLQSTGAGPMSCSITQTLTNSPASTFTVTPTFYDGAGSLITCPPPSGVVPAYVLLRSVGQASVGVT